jgi:uncharacterized protein involved in exopolysaccharide biosynthesis
MNFFDLKQLEYLKYVKSVQGVFVILLILLTTYLVINKPTFKSQTEIQFDKVREDSIKGDTL